MTGFSGTAFALFPNPNAAPVTTAARKAARRLILFMIANAYACE